MFDSSLARLRVIGFLEGASFLLLVFIAMPLKYLADQPLAVRYVGLAHGVLFLLYLAALVPAALDHRWGWKTTFLGVLASLLPGGPFVFDAKVLRPLVVKQS
jgi:integral membrane protein